MATAVDEQGDHLRLAGNSAVQKMLQKEGQQTTHDNSGDT